MIDQLLFSCKANLNQARHSKIAIAFFWLMILFIGAWLISQSQIIMTLDQGDFARAIASILGGPADGSEYRHWEKPTVEWQFHEPIASIWQTENTASAYFAIQAQLQHLVRPFFSLPLLALASKMIALFLITILSSRIAKQLQWTWIGQSIAWMALALAYFMAHNIYLFNSFYQEHVFWLGLPIILCGFLDPLRWRSTLFILFGATLCGAAKTQFFYMPILTLIWQAAWSYIQRKSQNRLLLIGLFLSQLFCTIPVVNNPYRELNFYHATYYGSYFLSSPQMHEQLQIPPETFSCIGSDRWGVVLAGKNGDERGSTITTCFDQVTLTTTDVLRPYLQDPTLLWRMWEFAQHSLWTARPFHNFTAQPYIVTPQGIDPQGIAYPFPQGNTLLALSDWREQHLTHRVGFISLLAIMISLGLLYWRWLGPIPLTMLFLITLIWSQIAIALIGEGFRDLGKHFAAAQLSYDLLLALLGVSILGTLQRAWITFHERYRALTSKR